MSLHDRIMRLKTDPHIETLPDGVRVAYKNGHKVARHDAAELSLEADELMAEMAACLADLIEVAQDSDDYADRVAAEVPKMALESYNNWKEACSEN